MAENRVCAACGIVSPPEARFCPACGANLLPAGADSLEPRLPGGEEAHPVAGLEEGTKSTVTAGEGGEESSQRSALQAKVADDETAAGDQADRRQPQRQLNDVDAEIVSIGDRNVLNKIGHITVKGNIVLEGLGDLRREQHAREEGDVALSEVLVEERRWVQRAFVKPCHYPEQWQRAHETGSRVFVVYGLEHAGKYTCALYLGMDLLKAAGLSEMQLILYEPSKSDIRSLPVFARHNRLGKKTVYIVRDAFENGVQLTDLCEPVLQAVNTALGSNDNYLILTVTAADRPHVDAPQVDAKVAMGIVFEHYLGLYETDGMFGPVFPELLDTVRAHKPEIATNLTWPFHARSFGLLLKTLGPEATVDDILQCARQAGRVDRQRAQAWFAGLPTNNARLYAMLVALFGGIDRFQLDEIYTAVVQWLRKDGVLLDDPRQTSLARLLEEIGAVVEAKQVRFSDADYARQVEVEIDNNHHLLWSLKDVILGWAREYSAPEYWELRRNLGAAIGRLGIYHLDKLRTVLNDLAHDDNGGIVAVAGYALDAVCRRGPRYQAFALDLLESWVKSGHPRLMWAAGLSIWRVYDGLLEMARASGPTEDAQNAREALGRAREILTHLTDRFDDFADGAKAAVVAAVLAAGNGQLSLAEVRRRAQEELDRWAEKMARSILHAIRRIALSDALGMVELVGTWLGKEKGSNLRGIGLLAAYQLFDENTGKDVRPLADRHGPLLKLAGPVLSTDDEIVDAMLAAFGSWLNDPEWEERIFAALLPLVNEGGTLKAVVLRAGLSRNWLEHEEPAARRLAQALISRSYLMDGYPADLPGHSRGLLLVDASREGRLNRSAARLGRALYQRLDSALDLDVAHLGGSLSLARPGDQPETATLQSAYPRSRLLMPPLEHWRGEGVKLALALTWGPIADLEDLVGSPWNGCLLVADLGHGTTWPAGQVAHRFNPSGMENDPDEIELWWRAHLARLLAARPAETWHMALAPYYSDVDLASPDALAASLEGQAAQLDDVRAALPRPDVARTLTAALLYLAAADLSYCVYLLGKWLANGGPAGRLAQAGGKMLFRVYGEALPTPIAAKTATLLELVPALAAAEGAAALPAILDAVRHWAADRDWQVRLLSRPNGGPAELSRMVDALPATARETLRTTLDHWIKPDGEGDEDTRHFLACLAERLITRLDLACKQPMPDLADGHRYGLLVVDTQGDAETVRRRLTLADALLKGMIGSTWETTCAVLCRLGDSCPLVAPGDKLQAADLASTNLPARPRLLGPLLESLRPAQAAFVLLLADDVVLDGEDWPDTDWGPRIVVYAGSERATVGQHFALIARQREPKEAEARVLRELSQRIGA